MRLKVADLLPGTDYAVQVRTVRDGVSSEWSERFLFTTDQNTIPPLAPTGVTWNDVGEAFFATWQPVTEDTAGEVAFITGYEIELVVNSVTKYITVTPKTGSDLSYTLSFDENVALWGTPQPTISFRVRAVNNKNVKGLWSATVTDSNPAPGPVTGLSGTVGADQITLKWVAPTDTDIKFYRVHVGTTSGFTPNASNLVYEGLGTTFSYTTSTYGVDHFFKVFTVDKFNQQSSVVTSVAYRPTSPFVVDTTAPDVPQSLSAAITNNANGLGARAAVSWAMSTAPSDLAGFYVRYRKVGDTVYSSMAFNKDDRGGTIELQSAFTNYEFQIRAFDWQNNESAWSATTTATSPANTAPGQTTGLASVAGRDSIRYTWTPSTAADLRDYEVTFSTSATFASGNITFRTGNSAFLNVGGLSPATTYYARVRAIDTNNALGTFSTTNTTTTLAQLTPADIGAPTNTQFATAVKTYSVEYSVNSSETTAPTTGWSTTTPTRTPGTFIWTRTVVTYQDNSTSTTNPALLTGNTGAPGSDGADGTDGSDGAPGRGISGTTVTYQVSSSGTTAPSGTWQSTPQATTSGQFLWTRTIYTYTDATTDTAYSVAAHGATGTAGTAGRGISGTTVTYQKHTNGTTAPTGTWTSAIPATAPGEFLWTRTVTNYTDSTSSTAYSVAAHGEAGSDGADGVGISSTTVTYQTHTNGTIAPTGTWSSSPTATVAGQFLWTRTVTSYTDSSSSTAYAVAAHGADGADGSDGNDGAPGRGISSTAVTYQVHTNGTTAPTGTWLSTVPSVPAGQFLWTRTIITYTDATTSTSYSVSTAGTNGTNGIGVTSVTPYFQTNTTGSAAPAKPTTNPPGGSWVTTEPAYGAGLQLWRTERILYTDNSFAYTDVSKVSAYTAATTAMTTANGKNKVIFSGSDASGTADSNGVAYVNGDIWYKRDGSGIVIATWEFVSGTGWVTRTFGDATLASLNVGKLLSGSISTALITLTSTGAIQSTNYNTTNKTGFRIDASGIDVQSGSVRAEAIKAGVLGGPSGAGVINIEAGTSLIFNGGYLKSNTYTGTSQATNPSNAGFYLGNDGLRIDSGQVKASTLTSGDISTAVINLTGTGSIQTTGYNGSSGFKLDSSGLSIPDGTLTAAKLLIQQGQNIVKPEYADFESTPSFYTGQITYGNGTGSIITSGAKYNSQYLQFRSSSAAASSLFLGATSTTYNVATEAAKTYIISAWVKTGTVASTVNIGLKFSNGTTLTSSNVALGASGAWQRISGAVTAPAGTTGAEVMFNVTTATTGAGIDVDGVQVEEKISSSNTPSTWTPPGMTRIDGSQIRTGSIQSTQTVTVNGSSVPAWSINTAGYASLAGAQILGNTVLGSAANDATSQIQSYNYVPGSTGWMIRANGTAELAATMFRGNSVDSISIWDTSTPDAITVNAGTAPTSVTTSDGYAAYRKAGGTHGWYIGTKKIPYVDGKLYRISATVRMTTAGSTVGNFYAGINGFDADKTTMVNTAGANSSSVQHYIAADNVPVAVADGWVTFEAYFKGRAATGDGAGTWTLDAPAALHQNVKYISPLVIVDYTAGNGTWEVRDVVVEAVDGLNDITNLWGDSTDSTLINGANIKTGTLTVDKLIGGNLDTGEIQIQSGSVLIAEGEMGEQVKFGDIGIEVIGAHETAVTHKAQSFTTVTLTTAQPHGYAEGSKVIISPSVGAPFPNEVKKFTVASGSTGTTLIITDSSFASATIATTPVTGSARGKDVTNSRDQPTYISFPTDGEKPNIISGVLTASSLVVTDGASLRGTSGIEFGAKLTIASAILPPTAAPSVTADYSRKSFNLEYASGSSGVASATVGPGGNIFVMSSSATSVVLEEYDGVTGAYIAQRKSWTSGRGGQNIPQGVTYDGTYLYAMYSAVVTNGSDVLFLTSYNSSLAEVGNTTWEVDSFPSKSGGRSFGLGWNTTSNRLILAYTTDSGVTIREHAVTTGVPASAATAGTTVTLAGTTNNIDIAFIGRGVYDLGTERIVYRAQSKVNNGDSHVNFYVCTTAGAEFSNDHWPSAETPTAGAWYTGGSWYSFGTNGVRSQYFALDSKWSGDTTQQRWIAYSWYDANATGGTHESTISPIAGYMLPKRAKMNVTIAPIPVGVGTDTPTQARVYVANASTTPSPINSTASTGWKLRETIVTPLTSAKINPASSFGATVPQTSNGFSGLTTNPGSIESTSGESYWRGDDSAQFKQLRILSSEDATQTASNKPPLKVGDLDLYGRAYLDNEHLRIDGTKIVAMATDTTRGVLQLQADDVRFNLLNGDLMVVGNANVRGKIRTNFNSSSGTSINFRDSTIVFGTEGWSASGPTAGNTVTTHHGEVHSWTGGIWMEDLAGQTASGANINGSGRIVRSGSSRKYKKYIRTLKSDEARKALDLEAVSFEWKKEMDMGMGRQAGFIAEQAHEAGLEWWVTYDEEGQPNGFRYAELTAAQHVIIKEHDEDISDLKSRVAELEKLVKTLVNSQA